MIHENNVKLNILQKQIFKDYMTKESPDIFIMSGGRGSGKSHSMAPLFIMNLMTEPENSLHGLGVAKLSNFHEQLEPLIRLGVGNIYTITGAQRDVMVFPGNRRVQVFSYSTIGTQSKLRGRNFSSLYLEEVSFCRRPIFDEAIMSTRVGNTKIFMTTNPEGQTHYLYQLYMANASKEFLPVKAYRDFYVYNTKIKDKQVRIYPSQSYDNSDKHGGFLKHSDIEYMEEQLPSISKKRLIYGEWVDSGDTIYSIDGLKYYDTNLKLSQGKLVCVIDPSYSSGHKKGNFSSIVIALIREQGYYIIDTGLIKNTAEDYTAKTVANFINAFETEHRVEISEIRFETVFNQRDTIKIIQELLPNKDIRGFQPKGNKLERMISMETVVKSKVFFNREWLANPDGYIPLEWIKTRAGRGYLGILQLCSFDGTNDGRNADSETMMVDFPDALCSLINLYKPEDVGYFIDENDNTNLVSMDELVDQAFKKVRNYDDDDNSIIDIDLTI